MNPALDVTTTTDVIKPGHKLRCSTPLEDAGGGGVNVARAICALGSTAIAVYPSGGAIGARIDKLLEEAGVPRRAVAIAGGTRQSLTVDEVSSGQQYRFVLPGPGLSGAEQDACLEQLRTLPDKPRWLVVSGSMPPGISAEFLASVRMLSRAMGMQMALDTSGPVLSTCEGLDADLIKPSLSEIETIAGRRLVHEADEECAARSLLRRGFARSVLLSMGARGALLVTGDRAFRLPAHEVTVRSTVGAGDTMLAAAVLALSLGWPLVEAAKLGVAAGAAALMAPGTSLARRADVERLYGGPIDLSPVDKPGA